MGWLTDCQPHLVAGGLERPCGSVGPEAHVIYPHCEHPKILVFSPRVCGEGRDRGRWSASSPSCGPCRTRSPWHSRSPGQTLSPAQSQRDTNIEIQLQEVEREKMAKNDQRHDNFIRSVFISTFDRELFRGIEIQCCGSKYIEFFGLNWIRIHGYVISFEKNVNSFRWKQFSLKIT